MKRQITRWIEKYCEDMNITADELIDGLGSGLVQEELMVQIKYNRGEGVKCPMR